MTAPTDPTAIVARLHALAHEPVTADTVHEPSALQTSYDIDSDDYFDLDLLATFRAPSSHLHSGFMLWPNRRAEHKRWDYVDGNLTRRELQRQSVGQRLRERWTDVRGAQWLYAEDRRTRHELPRDLRALLTDTLIGRPFHVRTVSGRILTEPVLRNGRHVHRVGQVLPEDVWSDATVMEIGGGYGALAHLLRIRHDVRLVLVDHLQALSAQAYYLLGSQPTSAEVLDGPWDPERHGAADIVLVPTWRVPEIPAGSVRLALNTYSFQEMRPDQVEWYLAELDRIGPRFLYSVNRVEKRVGQQIVPNLLRDARPGWRSVISQPSSASAVHWENLYEQAC